MNQDEFEYDEVKGAHGKRKKVSVLNKAKVRKEELDEIFGGELYDT